MTSVAAPPHPVRLAALLALLAMFGPFTIDALFPAFRAVAEDLHASAWQMQQTISVYLIAYALMSLFHGPLSDAYGRRIVILGGVIAYTFASIGCALADSIEALLIWRVLQGISTGAGLIVGRAMVRDLYDGPAAQRVTAMITLFFGIAPALAPVVGGLIFQAAGWHAIFWFLALYGVALFGLCWRTLPETHPLERRSPFRTKPLVRQYRTIAVDMRFILLVLATGFNFGAFFLYVSSAPAFVMTLLRLSELQFGWFFIPAIVGMMGGAALSARLAGRLSPLLTVRVGYLLIAAASLFNLVYNYFAVQLTLPWAVLPVSILAMGVSLIFPTLTLFMLDRYPGNRGAASSVQAFLWGLMTAAIAGSLSPLVSDRGMSLALGAALLSLLGWMAYMVYSVITPVTYPDRSPAEVLEPLEPR